MRKLPSWICRHNSGTDCRRGMATTATDAGKLLLSCGDSSFPEDFNASLKNLWTSSQPHLILASLFMKPFRDSLQPYVEFRNLTLRSLATNFQEVEYQHTSSVICSDCSCLGSGSLCRSSGVCAGTGDWRKNDGDGL